MTHPFHPLRGKEYEAGEVRQVRGYKIFVFEGEDGREIYIPVAWTDAGRQDPFKAIGGERSYFRVEDLIEIWQITKGEGE